MKLLAGVVALLSFIAAGTCFAQTRPNFSGTWILDASPANTGSFGSKTKTVMLVMKQTSKLLSIERRVGNRTTTTTYKLDGAESVNKTPNGADVRSKSKWVGTTLVTDSVITFQGKTSEASDVKSLSADGKVMTIQVSGKSDRGDVKETFIYRKR